MYSEKHADKAVRFIQALRHYKGKWAGKPFTLMDWQEHDIIRPLFGTLNPDGTRQFRKALIMLPRKNGKTELIASIALYLLFADGEQGAQIYSAANDKDQASLVFTAAQKMIEQNQTLFQKSDITEYRKIVDVHDTNSFYKAIARETAGSHGFDSSGVVFDELHTQKDSEFVDVLETGAGAREQPLFIAITTAGDKNSLVLKKELQYATNNFLDDTNTDFINAACYHTRPESKLKDPTYFTYIRAAEKEADYTDPTVWYEANPALEDPVTGHGFLKLAYIESKAHKAARDKSFENTFKRLHLNIFASSYSAWIAQHHWQQCAGDVPDEVLHGKIAYGGLDLSTSVDLTSFTLVFPLDHKYYIRTFNFIPEETMKERIKDEGIPYDVWAADEHINLFATPGNVVDMDFVEATILHQSRKYRIESISYDPWKSEVIAQHLSEKGIQVIEFSQTLKNYTLPTQRLQEITMSGTLRHGNDPVLNMASENMKLYTDPNENSRPQKAKSNGRIDPMVALIMALDRIVREQKSSVYDRRVQEGREPIVTI